MTRTYNRLKWVKRTENGAEFRHLSVSQGHAVIVKGQHGYAWHAMPRNKDVIRGVCETIAGAYRAVSRELGVK